LIVLRDDQIVNKTQENLC